MATDQFQTQTPTGEVAGIKIIPPWLALALLGVTLVLHFMLPESRNVGLFQYVGVILIAAGFACSFFGSGLFHGRETTVNPFGEPGKIVTELPFSFTRNPMYLGFTTALLGFALFFESFVMLLAPAIFFAVIDKTVIPREEAAMERIFGQQYLDYKAKVPRWIYKY
ncbi:MAG TPA: isoprenylcysteine carboxylmethyltransferase family protein [Candidatus Binataceae bacterium]|nr:isoprenylcysteine carboxylmethyltransferase family protein [Candidatus Binataceae bacterium]